MGFFDADSVATRVRQVLAGSAGTVRTIDSTRFLADYHDGLSDQETALRAVVKPRYDVLVYDDGPSDSSPPLLHSVAIKNIRVVVKLVRSFTFSEATSDSVRDDQTSLATQDYDAISQALGYPGNVTITSSTTSIVSNLLTPDGCDHDVQSPDGDRPGLIRTTCTFKGHAIVTQATS